MASDSLFTMLMTKKPGNFAEQVGAPLPGVRSLRCPAPAAEGRRNDGGIGACDDAVLP